MPSLPKRPAPKFNPAKDTKPGKLSSFEVKPKNPQRDHNNLGKQNHC